MKGTVLYEKENKYDVIVINDGSTDRTYEICKENNNFINSRNIYVKRKKELIDY